MSVDPATLLLEQFDNLLTTPEAVEELNRAILTLAVQGKLVAQDQQDKPASKVLERIRDEKETQDSLDLAESEKPFELPQGWEWVRLPEVTFNWGQNKPARPFSYIDVSSIDNLVGKIGDEIAIIEPENAPSRARKIVKKGSVIYSTVRPYLLNIAIIDRDIQPEPIVSTAFYVMHPIDELDASFLYLYLHCSYFTQFVESQMTGMAYPAISDGKMSRAIIPLPPLAEQHRIVARVEALFAQTRQLAEKLTRAQRDLALLNQSALAHLLAAAGRGELVEPRPGILRQAQDAFAAQWDFIAGHFESLFTEPEHIAPLRQSILELAVRGKLTRRESGDEPASVLLERIQAEKARLGKGESLPMVRENEKPFELPEGWEWTKLQEIADIGSGVAKGKHIDPSTAISLPYLRVANVQRGYLDLGEMKEIEIRKDEIERYSLKAGDLLLTEGGDADKLGRSTIWRDEIPNCIHQNHIFRARPYLSDFKADWLMLCTNSPFGRNYFLDASKQTTNLATINKTQLSNCPIPLPPLAEQQRIVAKVEQLLRLCDALEAKLRAAREERVRLTAAVLAGVGGVATYVGN